MNKTFRIKMRKIDAGTLWFKLSYKVFVFFFLLFSSVRLTEIIQYILLQCCTVKWKVYKINEK